MPSDLLSLLSSILAPAKGGKAAPAPSSGTATAGTVFADLLKAQPVAAAAPEEDLPSPAAGQAAQARPKAVARSGKASESPDVVASSGEAPSESGLSEIAAAGPALVPPLAPAHLVFVIQPATAPQPATASEPGRDPSGIVIADGAGAQPKAGVPGDVRIPEAAASSDAPQEAAAEATPVPTTAPTSIAAGAVVAREALAASAPASGTATASKAQAGRDDASSGAGKAAGARRAARPSAFSLRPLDGDLAAATQKGPSPVAGTALQAKGDALPVAGKGGDDAGQSQSQAQSQPLSQSEPQPQPTSPPDLASAPPAAPVSPPPQTAAPAAAPVPSQVATDTLAALSISVARRLNDGATTFRLELHPADFGKVEVSLVVGADGKVAAHLSFDSAATATAFSARESELRQQLAQAGLDVAGDALSFSTRDESAKSDSPVQTGQAQLFDARSDGNNPQSPGYPSSGSQPRTSGRRAARALAASASAAEDADLDTHLARLRRPASRLALDLTV